MITASRRASATLALLVPARLAIRIARRLKAVDVVDVLSDLFILRGVPEHVRSDNGPEFVSRALLRWAASQNLDMALIDPGKPWQNGTTESFNGKFRDECLSIEWFRSRREAAVLIEAWRNHCNEVRPHSSLQYLTPSEFKLELRKEPQPAVF